MNGALGLNGGNVVRALAVSKTTKGDLMVALDDQRVAPAKRYPGPALIGIAMHDAAQGGMVSVKLASQAEAKLDAATLGGVPVPSPRVGIEPRPAESLARMGAALDALSVTAGPPGVIGSPCPGSGSPTERS